MAEPSSESNQPSSSSRWAVFWDRVECWLYEFFGRGPIRLAVRAVTLSLWKHDGLQLASAMAFDLFLAMIPLLALAGWALSLVLRGNPQALHNLSLLFNLTPEGVQQVVNQHAERFFGGSLAPVALVGALWLASGAFYTVMSAFEYTLEARERPWWERRAIAFLCVFCLLGSLCLGGWVSLVLAGGLLPLLRLIPEASGVDAAKTTGVLVSLLTTTLLVAGFFRIGVHRKVLVRRVWPGTAVTLAIGGASSYLFAQYAKSLARYAFYYGSLAAVAVLLAWLWICSMALLLGAELNVYLEESTRSRHAERDT